MRTLLRRLLPVGLLAGLAYAIWRVLEARRSTGPAAPAWEAQPFPYPPVPGAAATATSHHLTVPEGMVAGGGPETEATAVEEPVMDPIDGVCPDSHPVKGKRSSGIYHVPGGRAYDRTKPDRCYCDAAAAEADGLRPSKV